MNRHVKGIGMSDFTMEEVERIKATGNKVENGAFF